MSRKQDSIQKKQDKECKTNDKTYLSEQIELMLRTPAKKNQSKKQEQVFKLMQPFPLPPKFNQQGTASSIGNYAFAQDMKVIETPYTHRNQRLTHQEIDIHDELRPITGKIFWDKTPAKSDHSSSQQQEDSEEQYSDENHMEEDAIREQTEEKEASLQENLEKSQGEEQPKFIVSQRNQKQRHYQKPLTHQRKIVRQLTVPQPNTAVAGKRVFCNCKKTKCLKLYCDCFRINQTCEGCNCQGCHNLEEYADERNMAIMLLMERNPDPFSQKIHQEKHLKGCNCKKSYCLKKYCECYQAGLKCGQNCKCDECKNGGGSEKRERDRLEREAQFVEEKMEKM